MLIRNFVVFEGGDGSGTTTQLGLLRGRFGGAGGPHLHGTFEPTDGSVGKLIRSILTGADSVHPETLARLFAADRSEHLYGPGGIIERVAQGDLVISDRYILSSLVYQGITCGEKLPGALNADFPLPETMLFFDIDPEIAVRRVEKRGNPDMYEYLDFQRQVRKQYLSLLPGYADRGVRIAIIDAAMPPEQTASAVWQELQNLPILKA
ncbi:MAG: dTMP kinase [Spirochaetaceae bacterium]|jgi:dTMP kinase|nr:dTMP kinase [Spirochaetaceae bacterium]